METGFGSPSIAGEEEWGFGDPEPAAGASAYPGDTGFGSPYIALEPAQVQVLASQLSRRSGFGQLADGAVPGRHS